MRRVTILSVLVLALAACGDDRASAPTPDIPQQPTEDSVGPLPNFPGGLQIESAAVAEGAVRGVVALDADDIVGIDRTTRTEHCKKEEPKRA